MCFTKPMSGAFAVLGALMTTIHLYMGARYGTRRHYVSAMTTFVYTLMETLQYYQHASLDKCDDKTNIALSKMAYILVAIQILVWQINWYFNSTENKTVFLCTGTLALVTTGFMLLRLLLAHFREKSTGSGSGSGKMTAESNNRGRFCTVSGSSHLAWQFDLPQFLGFEPNWFSYMVLWFVPLIFFRPIPDALSIFFSFAAGILGSLATLYYRKRKEETFREVIEQFASTWCLMSIPFLFLSLSITLATKNF